MTFIQYRIRGGFGSVLLEKINFIKSAGRKIIIDTVDEAIEFYGYMKEITPSLDNRFCQSHGSLMVNLTMIEAFDKNEVKFKNGNTVHIGTHNLNLTKKKYREYLETIAKHI